MPIEKPKRVFVCSPYAGDTAANVEKAKRYCRFAIDRGYAPFAPHLFYPQMLEDTRSEDRNFGILCGLSWLETCCEIWVFGETLTAGMEKEVDSARKLNIPVVYYKRILEDA